MRIHQSSVASPVVHTFAVMAEDSEEQVVCKLARRLELSVGGEGIVGRAVSVLDDGGVKGGVVVGEGVVGYGS